MIFYEFSEIEKSVDNDVTLPRAELNTQDSHRV